MPTAPILLLTGPPGAGKTSVATALLRHWPRGIHIPVDDVREWVVSGIAHPVPSWNAETTRQFQLARTAAVQIARLYADSGFVVVIDDVIMPDEAHATILAPLERWQVQPVLLLPSVDVARARNARRTNKAFDTTVLDAPIRAIHQSFSEHLHQLEDWLVLDTSAWTLSTTVEHILQQML